jgi:cyanophycin synthetase
MTDCPYCGPEPVAHWSVWMNEALSTMMHPVDRFGSGSFIHQAWDIGASYMARMFFFILRLFGASSYNSDIAAIHSPRAKVLWEEAIRRGMPMRSIRIFGKEVDCYEVTVNGKKIVFAGLPRPMAKRGDALWWMDDKALLKKKLIAAGIPAPQGGAVMRLASAFKIFSSIQKPVIVKPRFGSRGRHTLTHIHTEPELIHAFKIAKQLCPWVIVEEHLVGDVYRGTVIGGKLVGVLGGAPPRVTGDGVSTINQLIEKKNAAQVEGVGPFKITSHTHEFLARLGYSLDTILSTEKTTDLTEKIGVRYGGSSEEVENYHPGVTRALEDAGRILKNSILGFDFIIPDITKDPATQKWGIIECNSLPFINLHYDPLIGKTNNVARHVWDLF